MNILESATDEKISRFWSKVDIRSKQSCWPWKGYMNPSGYGQYKFAGQARWAHRMAYMLFHDEDPGDLLVRHRCDNPACCNPNHMLTGTIADNAADRVERWRSAFGTKNCNAKLTEDAVRDIRADPRPIQAIADDYGLNYSNIWRVKRGESWAHVK